MPIVPVGAVSSPRPATSLVAELAETAALAARALLCRPAVIATFPVAFGGKRSIVQVLTDSSDHSRPDDGGAVSPMACTRPSTPKPLPRNVSGSSRATTVDSAGSAAPMPTPASRNPTEQQRPGLGADGEHRVAGDVDDAGGGEHGSWADAVGQGVRRSSEHAEAAVECPDIQQDRDAGGGGDAAAAVAQADRWRVTSSRVVATLPSSNSAIGVRVRANPAARSSRRFSARVRRPTAGWRTARRASRAAIVIASAARIPGMIDSKMACRTPTAATSTEASSGPRIAPALSPARSTPNARP